ncbi:MAG TPA: 2OG-Fe(II) oxygenase [Pseudolabrys sp.]
MAFFQTVTIAFENVGQSGDLLTRLRRRDIDGVVVTGVYDAATCDRVKAQLEDNHAGLIRTDFPAKFAAFFYGINLNLAHPDLKDYFAEVPRFRDGLAKLLSPGPDLESRLTSLMSALDGDRPYTAAPGPQPDLQYMFTTIRAHLSGGYIPPHFDDEQAARPSYRLLMPLIEHKLFSFVLAFSKAQEGGALEIFNLQPAQQGQRIAVGDRSVHKPDLDALERVSVRLDPGDMIIFNSGHYLHRVTPVVGPVVRWTACSFMAEAKGGDRIYCWG